MEEGHPTELPDTAAFSEATIDGAQVMAKPSQIIT